MTLETAQQNWALLAAAATAFVAAVFVAVRIYQDSAGGRLAAAVRELRKHEKALAKAGRAEKKAQSRLEGLHSRVEMVKPRRIEEATGLLEDARALKKIRNDQVLVARNQVRMIIIEDYPPNQQEVLRSRYLPQLND